MARTRSASAHLKVLNAATELVASQGVDATSMDVVARSVYALGGKIGVSTNPGKFTRFKIVLPAAEAASSTAVA